MKRLVLMIIPALICGVVLWFTSSCKKEEIFIPPASQKILFQCYYINWAWGYSHSGFFIDREGKVMVYSQSGYGFYPHPDNIDWNFTDNQGNISEQALMENMQKTTISNTVIDQGTLKKYADKIYLVKENSYTEYQNANDMGAFVYVCYQYNENTGTYKQVTLLQNGDWVRKNNNKYAKQISDWLQTIEK